MAHIFISLFFQETTINEPLLIPFNDYTELFIIIFILLYILIKFTIFGLNYTYDDHVDSSAMLSGDDHSILKINQITQTDDKIISKNDSIYVECPSYVKRREIDECLSIFKENVRFLESSISL